MYMLIERGFVAEEFCIITVNDKKDILQDKFNKIVKDIKSDYENVDIYVIEETTDSINVYSEYTNKFIDISIIEFEPGEETALY